MEFYVNLRNYREAAGLTQLQVAERLGIIKSTYCNDADVVITRNSGRKCVSQGRVITRQRFDLPGV